MVESGAWICFDHAQRLTSNVLAMLSQYIKQIQKAYHTVNCAVNTQYTVRGDDTFNKLKVNIFLWNVLFWVVVWQHMSIRSFLCLTFDFKLFDFWWLLMYSCSFLIKNLQRYLDIFLVIVQIFYYYFICGSEALLFIVILEYACSQTEQCTRILLLTNHHSLYWTALTFSLKLVNFFRDPIPSLPCIVPVLIEATQPGNPASVKTFWIQSKLLGLKITTPTITRRTSTWVRNPSAASRLITACFDASVGFLLSSLSQTRTGKQLC